MYFSNILSALILISLLKSSRAIYYTISKDDYNVAGLPMQFNVTVTDSAYPLNYRFKFQENVTDSSTWLEDVSKVTKEFIFPNTTKPGTYRLNVQVYLIFNVFEIMKINGPSYIDFDIKDKLNGNIKYSQTNLRESARRNNFVSCYNPINFVSNIDDFHNHLVNVTYNWFINGTQLPKIIDNQMNYTFDSENYFNITTIFNATSKTNLTVFGRNELTVQSFRPVESLNITGIPNISFKRNKDLVIYVNFMNGTKPFWYCFKIFSDPSSKLYCSHKDETMLDYFKVSQRFSRNGTYYLKMKAGNAVTNINKTYPITVIDFERKAQMITIIMPSLAFIFILAIILTGVLYHLKKRNKFRTEIADFDFETRSQMDLIEKSFFQRIKLALYFTFLRKKETPFEQMENFEYESD